jgi:hypothetical protein
MPWIEGYKRRFQEPPPAREAMRRTDWRTALGDASRIADWIRFFDRELAEAPWTAVLRAWVPILTPGLMAAATHGLIRTGHAARSLATGETPPRRHELAEGLGYWAARYQVLPGSPALAQAGRWPQEAMQQVQRIHQGDFDASGSIVQQMKGLNAYPTFASAIDLVDTAGDLSQFISELTETCAALYLASQKDLVAFIHAVTAPSALRLLAPYLAEADARLAARYAWQGCAGIYAWYATKPPPTPVAFMPPAEDPETLIDQAVAAGGAHTIKFTEACLREYALHPKAVYLVAAHDVVTRVGGAF